MLSKFCIEAYNYRDSQVIIIIFFRVVSRSGQYVRLSISDRGLDTTG